MIVIHVELLHKSPHTSSLSDHVSWEIMEEAAQLTAPLSMALLSEGHGMISHSIDFLFHPTSLAL